MNSIYSEIYVGKKALSLDTEERKIVDMKNGLRIVTIDGKPLKDGRDEGFDFGVGCNRNKGMNLSFSILSSFFKEEAQVPNEFTYRFFKDVISKLDDEWTFNTNQVKEYCERIYEEVYGEEITN